MKYKTNKLLKKEKNRKSILTDNLDYCYVCGRPKTDINEIYEGAYRQSSIRYNCCIPMCRDCHSRFHLDRTFAIKIKRECQTKFESLYSYDLFMEVFKINYFYR